MSWPVRWTGHWIWYRSPGAAGRYAAAAVPDREIDTYAMFRRAFDLDAPPASLPARLTADGRYVLWVNGREAARGPVRSESPLLRWDEVDLAPHLVAGRNALAVLVRHYGCPTPWWVPAPRHGALGAGGLVMDLAEPLAELATGPAWRTLRGPWEPGVPLAFGPPNEAVDGRLLPPGWTGPGFDDSGWAAAVVLTAGGLGGHDGRPPGTPFTLLRPNPLPELGGDEVEGRPVLSGAVRPGAGAEPALPVPADRRYWTVAGLDGAAAPATWPVRLGSGQGVLVDFGRVCLGLLRIEVSAEAGTAVELRAGEKVVDGLPLDPIRQWLHRRILGGGAESVEPFETVGTRYLLVSAEGPVEVRRAGLRERRYPLDRAGRFECDDPDLNAIWALGRRTLELCATDAFLDCPAREQRAWLGDAYVSSLVALATSADPRLVVHALRLAAESQRRDGLLGMVCAGDFSATPLTIPDYSLHWIRAVARAHEHLGDLAPVRDGVAAGRNVLDWFWQFVEDGVLQAVPGWVFVDWWPLHGAGRVGSLHGLLLLALEDHAALARALGDAAQARESSERAGLLRRGFAFFRLPGRALLCEQPETGLVSQHVVATAVLGGAVDGEAASRMLEAVTDPGVVRYPVFQGITSHVLPADFDRERHVLGTQPFFAHWLHQAMARAGRHDLILASIRRWRQFLEAGDGSVWEFWVEGGQDGSHAHAWSATPTHDLTTHVLGVRPASPGFERVAVRPWLGPLRRLAGSRPTPLGAVAVELRRAGGTVEGFVELPEGMSGELSFAEWPERGVVPLSAGRNTVA